MPTIWLVAGFSSVEIAGIATGTICNTGTGTPTRATIASNCAMPLAASGRAEAFHRLPA
jgi:hypothetical protein